MNGKMRIYLTRHGQTDLNQEKLMQGRTDAPLNAVGIRQAEEARRKIANLHFDAVYASPLKRAIQTAAIIGGVSPGDIKIDDRIIETDFGKYERRRYDRLGLAMTSYWLLPELLSAPSSVETIRSMKERAESFVQDLEQKDYDNVLIVCHGGIMRVLSGCLAGRKNGLMWRPKPRNCEIRVFEIGDGRSMTQVIR